LGVKVILHVHELEQMFARLKPDEVKRAITYPSLIIANSSTTRNYLIQLGCKVPVEVVYPAFDTTRFRHSQDDYASYREKLGLGFNNFVWVMCGTLDPNKNGILFLDTADLILKSKPETVFIWIGATPDVGYKQTCLEHAERLGISSKVKWLSPSYEEYVKYFNCADGFMLTSRRESFSMVTVEALLLGLPVVAQNCGGVSEILDAETGVMVNELNNPEAMAAPMLEFMNGQRKVDTFKARLKAESFDIAVWAPKWQELVLKSIKN
jgi:glycosyltransferase involved in cell wall biosynthesis